MDLNYNIDNVRELLTDITDNKFVNDKGRLPNKKDKYTKIKEDCRYIDLYNFLKVEYIEKEQGIKYLIKYKNLNVTYSILRTIILKSDLGLHTPNVITDHLRNIRSINANKQLIEHSGFFSHEAQKNTHDKIRGLQGYYFNSTLNKYVWLRSSWEYIYAKWLNSHNIKWDVECKTFVLNNESYRPDFFIFDDDDNLVSIVEVKGYWKNRLHKYYELKQLHPELDLSLITDISPYTYNYKKDKNTWKSLRKLELNE